MFKHAVQCTIITKQQPTGNTYCERQAPAQSRKRGTQRLLIVTGAARLTTCPRRYDSQRLVNFPGSKGPKQVLGIMIPRTYSSSRGPRARPCPRNYDSRRFLVVPWATGPGGVQGNPIPALTRRRAPDMSRDLGSPRLSRRSRG